MFTKTDASSVRSSRPFSGVATLAWVLLALLGFATVASAGQVAGEIGGVTPDPSNPANPYDEVGQLHNELLDFAIGARSEVGSADAPLGTAMIGRAMGFTTQQYGDPCSVSAVDFDSVARIVADPEGANEVVMGTLDDDQVQYFLRIDEIASRLTTETESALDEMRALEAEILKNLPDEQAAPLLIGASVGRYSHAYWTTQSASSRTSPWLVGTIYEDGGAERKIPNWLKADLKGAISGAAGGIGGGGIGILVGGLLGGGVASAIQAIDDL
jgi:hypothetical protein